MLSSNLERNAPTEELIDDAATVVEVAPDRSTVENFWSKTLERSDDVLPAEALSYTET